MLKPICPLCHNDNIIQIGDPQISASARHLIDQDYKIVKCKECQLYFVHPEISFSETQWAKLYDKEYFGIMTNWWAGKRTKHRKARLELIKKYCHGTNIKFLEIGCGEGYILCDALKLGWDVSGLDIYDNRIAEAHDKNIKFHEGKLLSVSLKSDYYDIIYVDQVLEHIIDPESEIIEIKRILKRQGLVYIGVPNEDSFTSIGRKLYYLFTGQTTISHKIKPFKQPYHVIGFTKLSIARLLKKHDFQILRIRNSSELLEWRKHRPFTRPYFLNLGLMPFNLLAALLKRGSALEIISKKA